MIIKHVKREDVEIAQLYLDENSKLGREGLGRLLEREGLGANHHAHSGCTDQVEYINLVLDEVLPE